MPNLRIHPTVGVARIGNSPEFFVGPEIPGIPGNWDSDNNVFRKFKDADGKVPRQAARFRLFQFDGAGNPVREVTLADGVKIEWRVHVANRKASFFSFHGQSGAETNPPYTDRDKRPPDSVERKERGRGEPELKNKRNAGVADRRSLEIDSGVVSISSPGSVDLIDSQTAAPIKLLGQLRMEAEGRLLFLGGSGESASTQTPPPAIQDYANNDTWFDDMCDGVIQASVTLPTGEVQIAQSAWVIVGPPKFAPGIRNVVSLYDLLWDLAVRLRLPCQPGSDPIIQDLAAQQQSWQDATNDFAPSYIPSFVVHIYPVLSRALAAYDVQVTIRRDAHATFADWTRLSKATDDTAQMRQAVFRRVRDPNSNTLDRMSMPRGLGDDYTSLDDFENGLADAPLPGAFLSLTKVQYALLKAWAEGRFKEDWTFGDVTYAPIPAPTPVTPHGLDCAALENCVGGPFYPGIEVSWLIRRPELYAAAFRLKEPGFTFGPLTFRAGFFSQQMALPWHADFYDCHKEDHTTDDAPEPLVYMWWTAQRPDDVRAEEDGPYSRWVQRFDAFKEPDADDPDDLGNLARFEQMRTRWSELSFIVLTGDEHLEQK
jgi:hypothetical protein